MTGDLKLDNPLVCFASYLMDCFFLGGNMYVSRCPWSFEHLSEMPVVPFFCLVSKKSTAEEKLNPILPSELGRNNSGHRILWLWAMDCLESL